MTDSRVMELPVMLFRCKNGHEFEDVSLPGAYGQFVLRSASGEVVSVDAFDDPVFSEVDELANGIDAVAELDDARRGRVVRAAFQATIDPDSAGRPYEFNQAPPCPVCGSTVMDWFEQVEPLRTVDRPVEPATHHHWETLDDGERRSLVRAAALDELSS